MALFYDKDQLLQISETYAKVKETEVSGSTDPPRMQYLNQQIENIYLLYKLRLYCRYLSYNSFLPVDKIDLREVDFQGLSSLSKYQSALLVKTPALYAYRLTANLLEQTVTKDVENQVKAIIYFLEANESAILNHDQVDILSLLANFCAKAINTGFTGLHALNFRLHIRMIDLKFGADWDGQKLPGNIFKNAVVLALTQQVEIDWSAIEIYGVNSVKTASDISKWIASFIAFYGKRLSKSEQPVFIAYTRAYQLFQEQNPRQAYESLLKIAPLPRDFISLDVKLLKLMCYFQMEYFGDTAAKKILRKSARSLTQLTDSYRKQLAYFENVSQKMTYQVSYHRAFLQHLKQLHLFARKYHQVYKGEHFLFVYEKEKHAFIKVLKTIKYPYRFWMIDQLEAI